MRNQLEPNSLSFAIGTVELWMVHYFDEKGGSFVLLNYMVAVKCIFLVKLLFSFFIQF